jgi:hypothetical protein
MGSKSLPADCSELGHRTERAGSWQLFCIRGDSYYVLEVIRGKFPFEPTKAKDYRGEGALWKRGTV